MYISAFRNWFSAIACGVALAGCYAPAPSPTPPPGLIVKPRAGVVYVFDRAAHVARWKALSPGVRGLVLASTDVTLVGLVEYAASSSVADPYRDNIRYDIAGDGSCDVESTHIPIASGDVVVSPRATQRRCVATRGTLTFLSISIARGHDVLGNLEKEPRGGRVRVAHILGVLPARQAGTLLPIFDGMHGHVYAMKLFHYGASATGPVAVDRFVYIMSGIGDLTLDGRRYDLRRGMVAVVPAGSDFTMNAKGAPIDALFISTAHSTVIQ